MPLLTVMGAAASAAFLANSYDIEALYTPQPPALSATASMALESAAPASSIVFYLHGELALQSAESAGSPLTCSEEAVFSRIDYSMVANKVTCSLAEPRRSADLKVTYAGPLNPSVAAALSNYMRVDGAGVFLRGYGYSLWFPVFPEPNGELPPISRVRMRLTGPKTHTSVGVGLWAGHTVSGDVATDEWIAQDITAFDLHYAARPWVRLGTGAVAVLAMPDTASQAAGLRIASFANAATQSYRRLYRERADTAVGRIVEQLPQFGNTATSNVVSISDENWAAFDVTTRSAETLAHELVHAYVQVPTPMADPMFAMTIEGMPSYFHLPVLFALRGGDEGYQRKLDEVQAAYLERRRTGRDARGRSLPPEKPMLQMSPADVGVYKDVFVLNDRALLFWDWLRRTAGVRGFDAFVKELTNADRITQDRFFELLGRRFPALQADARLWLGSTELPQRFLRNRPSNG